MEDIEKELMQKISINKKMLECLELRLHYIDINKAIKNDYEINEDDILKILTNTKIDLLKIKIAELEYEFSELVWRQ